MTLIPNDKSNRANHAAYPLVMALLSGVVCYRLGLFAGCTSPAYLSGIKERHSVSSEQNSVINLDGGSEIDQDDLDSPSHYRSAPKQKVHPIHPIDRRSIPRTSLPYDCGVVFFYHIPSTGGRSINMWFRKYTKSKSGKVPYYQLWELAVNKDGSFHSEPEKCEAKFAEGMSKVTQNLGPKEWRVAHSHVTSTYLNESEDLLTKWRSDVEAQGCQLINTIMLRDPLNHAMSLHKIIQAKNSTQSEWAEYLSSPTGTGRWATVLDFFLYNIHGDRHHDDYPNGPGGRNPFNVTKEVKVKRAMELLHRHFDIVTVGDHETFIDKVLNWTGWMPIDVGRTNVHKKEMDFTKKEVETLQKLLQSNGDFDFVDQVKLDYHDYLSYLKDKESPRKDF